MCLTSVFFKKLQTICSTTVASKIIFNSGENCLILFIHRNLLIEFCLFDLLGMVIATIFLIILIFLPLDARFLILVSLFIIAVIPMMSVTPLMIGQLHVGGRHAGYLVGFTNFVGSTPSFILPVITGYVVQDYHVKIIIQFFALNFCFSSDCKILVKNSMEYSFYCFDLHQSFWNYFLFYIWHC